MPGAITHLKIAYKFNAKHNLFNSDDLQAFLIGSIAPDSVNLNGHAPKQVRWTSHLRSEKFSQWQKNLLEFYLKNREDNKAFILGYALHCLTDCVWDEYIEQKLFEKFQEYGVIKELMKSQRWQELDHFENAQLDKEWFLDVKNMLSNTQGFDVLNVKSAKICEFKDIMLSRGYVDNKAYKIFDEAYFVEFFEILTSKAQDLFLTN